MLMGRKTASSVADVLDLAAAIAVFSGCEASVSEELESPIFMHSIGVLDGLELFDLETAK